MITFHYVILFYSLESGISSEQGKQSKKEIVVALLKLLFFLKSPNFEPLNRQTLGSSVYILGSKRLMKFLTSQLLPASKVNFLLILDYSMSFTFCSHRFFYNKISNIF